MGAENSKSNSQKARVDNDNEARIEREVKRALEIQRRMYEQQCEELRQSQSQKDQHKKLLIVLNEKQVPNNNSGVEQNMVTGFPSASLYPSLPNATNNNIQTTAAYCANPSIFQMLSNTQYHPLQPTAPIEQAEEMAPTTTAQFKEQVHPGSNHQLNNNRLEPNWNYYANPTGRGPSTRSTNAQPVGQISTNAQPVGQISANAKPVGQISTNTKPLGHISTNTKPVCQKSTKVKHEGQKPPEPRNGARKKASPSFVECATCSNELGIQIYQCKNGHSSCRGCRVGSARCGLCTELITDMRNIALETSIADLKLKELDQASLLKVKCPNSADGCRLSLKKNEIEDHLKECPYREMVCPLAPIFGLCSWTGRITQIKTHFSEMHQEHYEADVDKEMYLLNVKVNHKIVYLVNIGTFTFVVHIQVDADRRAICMTVQTLGTKVSASKWTYELHVYNKREPRRKYQYIDTCVSSSESISEIFRQQKCAVLDTEYAKNFLNNNQLAYKFYIKRDSYPKSNSQKRNPNENSQLTNQ